MFDIPSIAGIVAAIGVMVGVVFTVLELRNLVKQRQTDLVIGLHLTWSGKEFREAWTKFLSMEYEDYNDFVQKYGPVTSGNPVSVAFLMVAGFFEGVGVLLHRKLIDLGLVRDLWAVELTWEKIKPVAIGWRKQLNEPRLMEWFECLYNEIQKKEQTPRRNTS